MKITKKNIKKLRGRKSNLEVFMKKEEESESGEVLDPRYWRLSCDQNGVGYAVIRFLPAEDPENPPWVRYWVQQYFNTKTKAYYKELSLTTIGKKDPCTDMHFELKNAGDEAEAKKFSRATNFTSNILVIEDPANPENNGKVFLFSYGKKIFEKIKDHCQPVIESVPPINVFDYWEGCNFQLVSKSNRFDKYDSSKFFPPSELDEDDIVAAHNSLHNLQELVSEDKYKSYEELEEKLKQAMTG